jgi:hypothetical protein
MVDIALLKSTNDPRQPFPRLEVSTRYKLAIIMLTRAAAGTTRKEPMLAR